MLIEEICEKTGVKEKEFRRCYKEYKWYVKGLTYINAREYVHRFSTELKQTKFLPEFNSLIKKIVNGGYLDGKNPKT